MAPSLTQLPAFASKYQENFKDTRLAAVMTMMMTTVTMMHSGICRNNNGSG